MNYPEDINKILRSRSTEWRFRYMLRDLDNLHIKEAIATLERLTKLMKAKLVWETTRKK